MEIAAAMGSHGQARGRLLHVLEDVYAASFPVHEKRWLALRGLLNQVGGSDAHDACLGDQNVRVLMEQALLSAKATAGFDHKPTITEAKCWLLRWERECGPLPLASRGSGRPGARIPILARCWSRIA